MGETIPATDRDLLTRECVAARLGRTPRTIAKWTKQGILPCIRVQRGVYYVWPDVIAALKSRCGVGYDSTPSARS
jgi:hypothetical protein